MNGTELVNSPKILANSTDILKDLLQGDPKAVELLGDMELDTEAIKVALAFLTSDPSLSDSDKSSLIQDSWRVNFRAKPPTPEEFLTERYLGAVAPTVLPRIKKIFLDFLDPDSSYRNLILYPHIGFGKASYYYEKIIIYLDFISFGILLPERDCRQGGKFLYHCLKGSASNRKQSYNL